MSGGKMFSTLTSKGQLTLPKKVREFLGLQNGDKVSFTINDVGKVEMTALKTNLKELKGMLKPPAKAVGLDDMRAAIENVDEE